MALQGWWLGLLLLWGTVVSAADVEMGFPADIEPYVFASSDQGIEVDIAREALAFRGHRLVPRYFRIDKLPLAFQFKRVDAVMINLGADLSESGGFYADPAVVYEDVLVSLKSRALVIDKPKDLANQLVVAFNGARFYYPDWIAPPKAEGLYFESHQQERQVLGLYRGHFDLMLTDRYIFRYFANKLAHERGLALLPTVEHEFTGVNKAMHRPVFRDAKIRDDFNAGLKHLRESGRYQAIYQHYIAGGFSQQNDTLSLLANSAF